MDHLYNFNWTPVSEIYDPIRVGSIDATDTEPHDHGTVRALNSTYKPNKGVVGEPERTIFIGRLNHSTDDIKLKSIFSKYGKVEKCRVVRDIITGFSKGYAFIEYLDELDAKIAIRKLNHTYIDDRKIIVMFECERTMPGWIPRRLGGGFGGRKESGQLRFGGQERPFKRPIIVPENLRIHKEGLKVDSGKNCLNNFEEVDDIGNRSDRFGSDKTFCESKNARCSSERSRYENNEKRKTTNDSKIIKEHRHRNNESSDYRKYNDHGRSRSRSRSKSKHKRGNRSNHDSKYRNESYTKTHYKRAKFSHRDRSRHRSQSKERNDLKDYKYHSDCKKIQSSVGAVSQSRNKIVVSQLS